MKSVTIPFQHRSVTDHNGVPITLVIDMDPGGGFEGGFEFTSISAPVPVQFTSIKATITGKDGFRFALHHEKVLDRIGKFFGMEDTEIGYVEFDRQLIVKTNDKVRLKKLFSDITVRKTFQSLNDFSLQINESDESKVLEFMIDKAVTDFTELKKIYEAFIKVLDGISE